MKILFLGCFKKNKSGNSFGGAEKSIINLANWLAKNNYDITLASVEENQLSFPLDEKVKFLSFESKQKFDSKQKIISKINMHYQIYLNTKKAIKMTNPDVIISFWIHPLLYTFLSKKNKKYVTIYSERCDPNLEYSNISKLVRKIVMNKVSGIVFQTNDAKEYFPLKIQNKSIVIHNPVYVKIDDYELPQKLDNRIVSIGRLDTQKNYSILIDAFYQIKDKFPDLILEIYGEGALHKKLDEQIKNLNLEKRVFLKGTYKDVLNRIYGARLFVLPSIYEGMPNTLMEAMSLGIPAISSNCPCGGPKELIKDGYNGYLFELDEKDGLLKKICSVLENKNIMDVVKNEKQICVTHSQDSIFKTWLNYIEKLLDKEDSK